MTAAPSSPPITSEQQRETLAATQRLHAKAVQQAKAATKERARLGYALKTGEATQAEVNRADKAASTATQEAADMAAGVETESEKLAAVIARELEERRASLAAEAEAAAFDQAAKPGANGRGETTAVPRSPKHPDRQGRQ